MSIIDSEGEFEESNSDEFAGSEFTCNSRYPVTHLTLHVLGSSLEIQCLRHLDLQVLPPIHSSGSYTLPQLGLVLFPSMPLLVFGHCLCIICTI